MQWQGKLLLITQPLCRRKQNIKAGSRVISAVVLWFLWARMILGQRHLTATLQSYIHICTHPCDILPYMHTYTSYIYVCVHEDPLHYSTNVTNLSSAVWHTWDNSGQILSYQIICTAVEAWGNALSENSALPYVRHNYYIIVFGKGYIKLFLLCSQPQDRQLASVLFCSP